MKLATFILALTVPAFAASEQQTETAPHFPQQQSGSDLLKACASSSMTKLGRERRQYCAGFISGVEEAVRLLESPVTSTCPPSRVTAREMARVYTSYASKRQAELSKRAAEVVLQALMNAYPCDAPAVTE